jgi:prepilin-type processing-associated H-X9-DG protein
MGEKTGKHVTLGGGNANRVKSASNLRQIGQGMVLYANENGNKYPPNLGEICKTQELEWKAFVSPATGKTPPDELLQPDAMDGLAKWINANSDYVYLGAGKTTAAPDTLILAYEKYTADSDGANVLFGDGHVEWLSGPPYECR